ncbi:MAG TPA: cation:proton antiporter, partial [Rhizomicrobium sp.]|nr:cation:proton antiporter [Rhizomicrobium sp.]
LGGAQVVLTAILASAAIAALGQPAALSIILGTCLAWSSTAMVLELLSAQGRLSTTVGRASVAALLAQDLAVIPLLMFVSIIGHSAGGSVGASFVRALAQAAAAVGFIVLFGHFAMRPLLRVVAQARSTELFIAAILFVIVGAAVVANLAGLSMSLGAFVAGLLFAETEYGKAIQVAVKPFQALLLGIFFFTVGMNIDLREILREPGVLVAGVLALLVAKTLVTTGLARLFRLPWPAALETGLLLASGSEFAFVGIGAAVKLGLVGTGIAGFTLAVVSISMALVPALGWLAQRLKAQWQSAPATDPALFLRPAAGEKHAIVVGYGRVGKVVCALLEAHGIPFVATDSDPRTVTHDRRAGFEVFYGDASDRDYLEACGLGGATAVIITINDRDAIDAIMELVRETRPDIPVIARARDAEHARHLYAGGATDAVPETIEASLQLSEAALVGLGVAMGPAIASIHERRDLFRNALQQAAREAGLSKSHAIRRKTLRRS